MLARYYHLQGMVSGFKYIALNDFCNQGSNRIVDSPEMAEVLLIGRSKTNSSYSSVIKNYTILVYKTYLKQRYLSVGE